MCTPQRSSRSRLGRVAATKSRSRSWSSRKSPTLWTWKSRTLSSSAGSTKTMLPPPLLALPPQPVTTLSTTSTSTSGSVSLAVMAQARPAMPPPTISRSALSTVPRVSRAAISHHLRPVDAGEVDDHLDALGGALELALVAADAVLGIGDDRLARRPRPSGTRRRSRRRSRSGTPCRRRGLSRCRFMRAPSQRQVTARRPSELGGSAAASSSMRSCVLLLQRVDVDACRRRAVRTARLRRTLVHMTSPREKRSSQEARMRMTWNAP